LKDPDVKPCDKPIRAKLLLFIYLLVLVSKILFIFGDSIL